MPQTNLPVIDARPGRETQYFSTFRRSGFWRMFLRSSCDVQGSAIAKGFMLPTFLADYVAAGANFEDQTGTPAGTALTVTTTPVLSNMYFLPPNAACTITAQTIIATIPFAYVVSSSTNLGYIQSATLELVKISAAGTITSLASQTVSGLAGSGSTSTTPWTVVPVVFSINLASPVSIAATERIAIRASTTGNTNNGSATVYHAIGLSGVASFATTIPTGATVSPVYIKLEVI